MDKENAPFFGLPNNMKPENYNTKIMHTSMKVPMPNNMKAEKAPSLTEAMKGMTELE